MKIRFTVPIGNYNLVTAENGRKFSFMPGHIETLGGGWQIVALAEEVGRPAFGLSPFFAAKSEAYAAWERGFELTTAEPAAAAGRAAIEAGFAVEVPADADT